MTKIHDPNLDAMFRNHSPQQGAVTIASPLNDIQLVALLAAVIGATTQHEVEAPEAVKLGINLVAESIVQMSSGELNRAVDVARQRLSPNGPVLAQTQ